MSELDLPEGMTYRAGDYLAMYALLRLPVTAHSYKYDQQLANQPRTCGTQGDRALWTVR